MNATITSQDHIIIIGIHVKHKVQQGRNIIEFNIFFALNMFKNKLIITTETVLLLRKGISFFRLLEM